MTRDENSWYKAPMVRTTLICSRNRRKINMARVDWAKHSKTRYVGKNEIICGLAS